jgi:RNA polymerase sigma factor (sigma-70 family)
LSADASFSPAARLRAGQRSRLRPRLPRGRSDDALAARVRAGDERAFELVFDRYHRGLLAFCRHMLGANEEAEDALQHTFMAAYRGLCTSDRPIRLKAWLYTIARNCCLSILRARREQVALDEGHAAADGLAADVDRRAELRGLLADLEQLPEEQRAALVLFELGDHSHDEIAEVLGVRREKVKALVFQARESLAGWRRARETPCVEIREQLATARGAALKRATLRRHVARCQGCAEFESEVRHQRAAMAALLPVVPTVGLKAVVLGAIGAGAGGAGGGSLAGIGGAAKGVAAKTLMCAAVAGSAGSAGYVAVHEVQMRDWGGLGATATTHRAHAVGKGAAGAARAAGAAKPMVAPVVGAAAARAPAPAKRAASGQSARGKHAGWHHRFGKRGRSAGRGNSLKRGRSAGRGNSLKRGRSARRGNFLERGRSSARGGFGRRDGSGARGGSAKRDGSGARGDSGKRGRSADRRGLAKRGGSADRRGLAERGGASRRGTEGKRGGGAHSSVPRSPGGGDARGRD